MAAAAPAALSRMRYRSIGGYLQFVYAILNQTAFSARSAFSAVKVAASDAAAETGLDLPARRFENGQPGVALVISRDEVPWRKRTIGKRQHVTDRDLIASPFATVAPVLGVDLVPFVGGRFAFAEPAELLLLADL